MSSHRKWQLPHILFQVLLMDIPLPISDSLGWLPWWAGSSPYPDHRRAPRHAAITGSPGLLVGWSEAEHGSAERKAWVVAGTPYTVVVHLSLEKQAEDSGRWGKWKGFGRKEDVFWSLAFPSPQLYLCPPAFPISPPGVFAPDGPLPSLRVALVFIVLPHFFCLPSK